jgi:hypothetical protein
LVHEEVFEKEGVLIWQVIRQDEVPEIRHDLGMMEKHFRQLQY